MVNIRPEQPRDVSAIYGVNAACFPGDDEARLVDFLCAAGNLSVSLVADDSGSIVGHIAFSPVSTAAGVIGAGLAPLAVLDSHRRQGIAEKLVHAGLEACREMGFGWCVVLGEPAYYGRFGFRPAPEFGLSDEYGGGGAFQVIELIPDSLPVGSGLVRYAPEFGSLG